MENILILAIIGIILAPVCAGTVFVVCWARMIHQEARINSALCGAADVARVESKVKDILLDMEQLKAFSSGLEESMSNLNAKWASRDKAEAAKAKREKASTEEPEITAIPLQTQENTKQFKPQPRYVYRLKQGG